MLWLKSNTNEDDDNNLTRSSTINSITNHHLIPPTPTQKNLFSRAYDSLFGGSSSSKTVLETATTTPKLNSDYDYSAPLNQTVRTFGNINASSSSDHNLETPSSGIGKSVNWGGYETKDRTLEDFDDSDEEVNETLNSIRNIKFNNNIPGTYPDRFPSPYIPRNYKVDQDILDNRETLQRYLNQINETNKFLEELLATQQYEKINQKGQTAEFVKLKKEYAKELETSKQVYEGFRRLLFKYKSVKDQLRAIDNGDLKALPATTTHDLQIELEAAKRSLMSKTKRIEEMERDLKRATDQRDDLKTTILEYKNQNLRLKTANEMLKNENTTLTQRLEQDQSVPTLEKKNEMLEMQITRTNEMFKNQTNNLKEQIFDLQSDLKRQKELHEYEIYSKDKRIGELEKLLSFKSPTKSANVVEPSIKSSRSRPLSYHEPSTRVLSPLRLNVIPDRFEKPNLRYRSEVLNNIDENTLNSRRRRTTPKNYNHDYSISDISLILNNNHSEDLTGFDNDVVTKRLTNKAKLNDAHDLSAIFSSPHY